VRHSTLGVPSAAIRTARVPSAQGTYAVPALFALPPNELVLWTMLLTAAILAVYWRCSARRHFAGPRPRGRVLG